MSANSTTNQLPGEAGAGRSLLGDFCCYQLYGSGHRRLSSGTTPHYVPVSREALDTGTFDFVCSGSVTDRQVLRERSG